MDPGTEGVLIFQVQSAMCLSAGLIVLLPKERRSAPGTRLPTWTRIAAQVAGACSTSARGGTTQIALGHRSAPGMTKRLTRHDRRPRCPGGSDGCQGPAREG